jgi:hypothetical protein
MRHSRATTAAGCCLMTAALLGSTGCKSDLNQQLLERELRYQEDQIYQLQDELQEKCARLDRMAGENTSLRRQLGVADSDPQAGPRAAPVRPRSGGVSAPVLVPPAIEVPDSPAAPGGPPSPGSLAPPTLEGIPPLPQTGAGNPAQSGAAPTAAPAGEPLALPTPTEAAARPLDAGDAAGQTRRLSFETADTGRATRVVINPRQTACVDADSDGTSEGISVVFEPRDEDERLVAAAGDVTIAVYDVSAANPVTAESVPIARLDVPAAQALASFRRTSRNRGMQFSLRWPGNPPAGSHVRVAVRLAVPDAPALESDATIAVRDGG